MVRFEGKPSVLRCFGDEDRSTKSRRRRALSQALTTPEDLEVDLSGLAFADASLMVDLAMVATRLRKAGRAMHVYGAEPHIHVLIEMVGLHRLPAVTVVA